MLELKDNLNMLDLYSNTIDTEYVKKLLKTCELTKNDKLSILGDSMFHTMFLNKQGLKYSAKLFTYFFKIKYEQLLKKLKFYKNDVGKNKSNDIGERCDYVAQIDDSIINLEVNNNESVYVLQRNIDYAFRLYSETVVKKGPGYDFSQIIQINLNNFAFKGNDKTYEIFTLNSGENILTYKLIIINIYVPNIIKKCYNEGVEALTEMERYILGLVEEDSTKAISLGKDIDIMEEYVSEALKKSKNEGLRRSYDKELALIDQGERRGYMKGRKLGLIDVALKMLKNGDKVEYISEITNLSIEEIIKLNN